MAHSNSGIYEIRNLENGKRYIGSAVNPPNRKRQHLQSLARGDHHSVSLQRAWNKYGADKFKFIQLIICSKENLITYEQAFIDGYKPEYNIAPRAGSQLGFRMSDTARKKMSESRPKDFSPMTGKKHSDATKAKISASRKGKKSGDMTADRRAKIGAAHKGRIITEDHRSKISATLLGHKQSKEQIDKRIASMPDGHYIRSAQLKAKLTDEQVRSARLRVANGESMTKVGSDMGVTCTVISRIIRGLGYGWVSV